MNNMGQYLEIEELGLSAKGEVFINKDLPQIISLAKTHYKIPYVYISSNGALATKEKLEDVISLGLDSIKFSINAFSQEEYKNVHLVDDFEKVINNLNDLLDLKDNKYSHVKVFISAVTKLTKEEVLNYFKKLCPKYKLINDILIYPLGYTQRDGQINSSEKVTRKCPIPLKEIYINSDCNVVLCCVDYFGEHTFGSLLNNDFLDIYKSDKFTQIRKMHLDNQFPDNHLCRNCLLFKDV